MADVVSKIWHDIMILYREYRCGKLFSDLISHITNAFSSTWCVIKLTELAGKMCVLRGLRQKRTILSRSSRNQMINKQGSLGRKNYGQFIAAFIVAHCYVCNTIPEHSDVFFSSYQGFIYSIAGEIGLLHPPLVLCTFPMDNCTAACDLLLQNHFLYSCCVDSHP
jgi:hypothetical protein